MIDGFFHCFVHWPYVIKSCVGLLNGNRLHSDSMSSRSQQIYNTVSKHNVRKCRGSLYTCIKFSVKFAELTGDANAVCECYRQLSVVDHGKSLV
jgi:hypothetical protein